MSPTTPDDLFAFGLRDQAREGLAGGHVRERTAFRFPAFPLAMMRRFGKLGKLLPLAGSDDEEARSGLGDPVVGGVEDLPVEAVTSGLDLLQQARERRLARLVVEGERVHVLENEVARSGFSENPRVGLKQARRGVDAVTLPVEPEA